MTSRLFTRSEAAAYCHLKPSGFSQWVLSGRLPGPIPGTRRWDRRALDAALDKVSGLSDPAGTSPEVELERWLKDARRA